MSIFESGCGHASTSVLSPPPKSGKRPGFFGRTVQLHMHAARVRPIIRTIARNASLYVYGEAGSTVFIINKGWVKRLVPDRAGKPSIMDMHQAGDIVGEMSFADGLRHDSAVAKSDCVVDVVQQDVLMDVMRSNDLLPLWTAFLCERLRHQQEIIAQFVSLDSERRLAVRLLTLTTRTGGSSLHRITHEELAAMIGTTRSRVGVFLQRFEDIGLINRTSGRIVVLAEPLRRYLDTTT